MPSFSGSWWFGGVCNSDPRGVLTAYFVKTVQNVDFFVFFDMVSSDFTYFDLQSCPGVSKTPILAEMAQFALKVIICQNVRFWGLSRF